MLHTLLNSFIALGELIERIPTIILIGIGVPMMLFGASWLVSGSVAIARRMGVSVLLIGLTIVAAGTSAPELAVNIIAAIKGNPGLSFGNVIGSNIANIGLIVAIGALIRPMVVHDRVVHKELPLLLAVSGALILLSLAPWMRPVDPDTGERLFGFGRADGIIMSLGFIAMTYWWYRLSRDVGGDDVPVIHEAEELVKEATSSTGKAWMMLIIGLALLIIGGKFTEVGAVKMARYFDLSDAVIGMTVVAVATSLPELVTTIIACRRGHADLAVGNIVGSNVFNLLLILGVTATITDVPVPGVVDSAWLAAGWQDIGFMMALSVLLWWFAGSKRHVTRREGGALLVLYVGYIGWSVAREMVIG